MITDMKIKALCIRDPWASMIVDGKKTIETRTWRTKYRGPILIVKSLKPSTFDNGMCIGMARLADIRTMDEEDEVHARCEMYDRAQAWYLEDIVKFKKVFPVKGQLGLFDVHLKNVISQEDYATIDWERYHI